MSASESGGIPLLRLGRVRHGDRAAALGLVFAHLSPADRDRRLASLPADSPDSPSLGLWGAYRGEQLVAAMLAQVQPGKTAVVYPPRAAIGQQSEIARELLTLVVAELPRQGVKMAQVLLETDHGADVELLSQEGFRHASNLLYLVSMRGTFPRDRPGAPLEFCEYSPRNHARLADVIERTYVDSRDCPSIDRVRDIEDVLAGYRSTGEFDPARWMIAEHEGADVGCLLLADDPANKQCELTYMGVVPEARGRGYGVSIARRAQWLAAQAGRERLVLAVDADNVPAIGVYAAAGFVSWDHRSVFLRVF